MPYSLCKMTDLFFKGDGPTRINIHIRTLNKLNIFEWLWRVVLAEKKSTA